MKENKKDILWLDSNNRVESMIMPRLKTSKDSNMEQLSGLKWSKVWC